MNRHPILRRVAAILFVVTAGVVVAACSLPVDERVTPIDQGDFPDDLTDETTTTTTTVLATTTAPPDTAGGTVATTTTVAVIPTEAVTVYYTRGITDVMQPVEIARAVGTPVLELVPLLESPTGITEAGLRTSLLPGLIDRIPVERGTATVVLEPNVLDRMSNQAQQRAIAQIVLTLTSFVTNDAGAIGFVRFEVDGEGFSVYVPGFGGTSEAGEPLAFTDFSTLIATTPTSTEPDTSSTTPTTTPTTTLPADAPENPEPANEGQ